MRRKYVRGERVAHLKFGKGTVGSYMDSDTLGVMFEKWQTT